MSRRSPPPDLDPLDAITSQDDATTSIEAWLNVVSLLMHLPETTRHEICDELREHLRERVRDLMLAGGGRFDERAALRTAIDELGETAQLARRFEAANRPQRRRRVMHATLMLAGAAAIAAGTFTFTRNNAPAPVPTARFGETQTLTPDAAKALGDARLSIAADATLREALDKLTAQAKVGLMVNWGEMESVGIDHGAPMGLSFNEMPAADALTLIARMGGTRENPLDWRVREKNMIEFGVRHELDRREIELSTYDISATIHAIAGTFAGTQEEAMQQILELLSHMVEPENWRDNGGDLAQLRMVGGRLFVEAPPRMQTKVKWILDQLPATVADQPAADAVADHDGVDLTAREGAPVLSDIPILGHFFAQAATDDAAMSDARSELEAARTEFEIVKSRFREGSTSYQHAEARLELAEAGFARMQSLAQPQPLYLKPGDLLTIEVLDLVQPGQWYTATREIEADGMVRFPLVGEIKTTRLSAREVEAEVVELLSNRLNEPKVSVYRARAGISAASGGEQVAR